MEYSDQCDWIQLLLFIFYLFFDFIFWSLAVRWVGIFYKHYLVIQPFWVQPFWVLILCSFFSYLVIFLMVRLSGVLRYTHIDIYTDVMFILFHSETISTNNVEVVELWTFQTSTILVSLKCDFAIKNRSILRLVSSLSWNHYVALWNWN